jgi:acetoin utilization protein AcuC
MVLPIPVFYSTELHKFNFGQDHPFNGERFAAFIELLKKAKIAPRCEFLPPVKATDKDLLLVHTPEYLGTVKALEKIGGWLTMDTPVTPQAEEAQRLITGSGLQAAKLLIETDHKIAHTFGGFHHAGRDYGEGFCIYNDVAVVTQALLDRHKLQRIMILDTDAHQGNGTMDIFNKEPRVLFVSIHQDPKTLYPGRGFTWETGIDEGRGYTINLSIPPYAGNEQYMLAFEEIIEPIASEFNPQLIIRNGGSDPYYRDELTMLGLNYDGLNRLGRKARSISKATSGKLLDMMVSGYGDQVIYGWLSLFCGVENLDTDYKSFAPEEPPPRIHVPEEALNRGTKKVIQELKSALSDYWKCL